MKGITSEIKLNTFLYWTLNRIDYAVNISTLYIKEYIELFQRTDIPYDKKAKVRKHKPGAFGSLYIYQGSAFFLFAIISVLFNSFNYIFLVQISILINFIILQYLRNKVKKSRY